MTESRQKSNTVNPVEDLKAWLAEHSVSCMNCVNSDMRWDELTRRIDQLSNLMDVSKAVAAQLDLNVLLQQIVSIATRLVSAEFGGLLVFDREDCGVQFFKTAGWEFQTAETPTAQGLLGLAYRQGAPLRLDDVTVNPQAIGFPVNHPEIGPFLSVPLMRKDDALGVLFVGNTRGRETFTAEDEEILLAFAAQAAIAIENARLYSEAEELARLRERHRIAQALHDTVAQRLFSVGLDVQWLLANIPDNQEIQQKLQSIRRLSSRSSDELRTAIFALRSEHIARCDALVDLLQEQIEEFQAESGIAATLIVPPQCPSLPPLVCDAIYRIVREALSNVRKHAQAPGVVVSLLCENGSVVVSIQDNGIGLPDTLQEPDPNDMFHFGLITMHQLAEKADGDFEIRNNDDQGALVRARFPVFDSSWGEV